MGKRYSLNDWERGDFLGADFSEDRRHRYELRRGGPGRIVTFIGLNPSVADETWDDHTIRRCAKYAESWGCTGLRMVNLFALCSTSPRGLVDDPDPVGGGHNDRVINWGVRRSDLVIAAWGASLPRGIGLDRARRVGNRFSGGTTPFFCLGLTDGGHPLHPSRANAGLQPIPYGGYERRKSGWDGLPWQK